MIRAAKLIAIYVRTHDVPLDELATAWECSKSTVSRFLHHGRTPNGEIVARMVTWFLERCPPDA